MSQWAGVVLAAGMSTRMNSRVPKVLHPVCGKEMIRYPVDLLRQLGAGRIVVVVSRANSAAVRELLADQVEYATQPAALGTGDALAHARELLRGAADHLVVLGADSPLVQVDTVKQLMASHLESSSVMSILVGHVTSVGDLGCVIRDGSGQVAAIVEAPERKIDGNTPGEINGGVYCFSAPWLWDSLERIEPNSNGERYLTSLAAIGATTSARDASRVSGVAATDPGELQGVNNRLQLAQVEAVLRQRIRHRCPG